MTICFDEGEVCGRDGCEGILRFEESENCSCHLHPPCESCISCRMYCPVCGWRDEEEI